uniref:Uncharacterized protein n=1 Tax=Leptobrachium leishanense TaxID=445787 RepID=A0A8C5MDC3_9ANUR
MDTPPNNKSAYFDFRIRTCRPKGFMQSVQVNGGPLKRLNLRLCSTNCLSLFLLLGKERFAGVDIRARVKRGGQVYPRRCQSKRFGGPGARARYHMRKSEALVGYSSL